MKNENKKLYTIDTHAHPPRKGCPGIDERPYAAPLSEEEKEAYLQRDLQEILQSMEMYGIDKKGMLAMPPDIEASFHYGEKISETGLQTYTSHEWIIQAQRLYPEKFYGCACLNPLDADAIPELERLVREFSFKGVKIHQAHYRFEVNDRRAYPFYEKCIELDIPVAFHTGYSPVKMIDRLIPTMPLLLDELAYDLPELRIVMCHAGGNWYQDGTMVALRNDNIVVDISGLPWICQYMVFPEIQPVRLVRRIVDILGADRVLYGTDNADTDLNPDLLWETGLNEKDLKKIAGENAVRVWKL